MVSAFDLFFVEAPHLRDIKAPNLVFEVRKVGEPMLRFQQDFRRRHAGLLSARNRDDLPTREP